jgi:isoleucyl-tRNA synthetase
MPFLSFPSFFLSFFFFSLVLGSALVGLQYVNPLTNSVAPVLSGDFVTVDSGTGLVHTAPAHGLDDYRVCKQQGINILSLGTSDSLLLVALEFHVNIFQKYTLLKLMTEVVTLRKLDPSFLENLSRMKERLLSLRISRRKTCFCWFVSVSVSVSVFF